MTNAHRVETGDPLLPYDGVGPREETSLLGFANVVLKHRRMIAVFVIAFGAYGLVRFFESQPVYTTRIGVNVQAARDRAPQSTLSALLGAVRGAASSGQEVAFFNELLRSPPLLRDVAAGTFTVHTAGGVITGPLTVFYRMKGRPEEHEDETRAILTDNVRIVSSPRTGNVWVFVDAPYPELAQQIANSLILHVDQISRRRRHSENAAARQFVQERMASALTELRAAEEQLVQFQLTNRTVSSPPLMMASERLRQDISIKQALYTSLLQSYDRARIEEARDLPAVTILELPELPLKRERSPANSLPLLSAIGGLLIAIVIAFIRERVAESSAAATPAFEYYTELKRETIRGLRSPFGQSDRARGSRPGG